MNEQERAKTRPDGNDPKESFGAPPIPLFLPVLASPIRDFFFFFFSPYFFASPLAPSLHTSPWISLSFFLFLTWDNRERVEATDTEQDKAKTSSDGNDFDIF